MTLYLIRYNYYAKKHLLLLITTLTMALSSSYMLKLLCSADAFLSYNNTRPSWMIKIIHGSYSTNLFSNALQIFKTSQRSSQLFCEVKQNWAVPVFWSHEDQTLKITSLTARLWVRQIVFVEVGNDPWDNFIPQDLHYHCLFIFIQSNKNKKHFFSWFIALI